MFIKDAVVKSFDQLRAMYPHVSFTANTPAELGWAPYTPPPYVPTSEQIQQRLTFVAQLHLDAKAREKGYDNIVSACSYAAVPNIFQAEGIAFINWRSDVWAHCYQALADVQAQARPIPTEAELLAELPAFVEPAP